MITLNNFGMSVTPFTIDKALMLSGLEWHLPLAQIAALEANALSDTTQVSIVLDGKAAQIRIPKTLPRLTIGGIPMVLDKTLRDSVMELRGPDRFLIARIEGLAVPVHMESKQA